MYAKKKTSCLLRKYIFFTDFFLRNMIMIYRSSYRMIFVVVAAKTGKDGKPEACRPITKVEWKTTKNG